MLFFIAATSAHAGDLALQPLELSHDDDDDDTASEETNSICTTPSETSNSRSSISISKHRLDHVFDEDTCTFADALWDHVTLDTEELAFRVGEVIQVTDFSDRDWWYGVVTQGERSTSGTCSSTCGTISTGGGAGDGSTTADCTREGWFPSAFVRVS